MHARTPSLWKPDKLIPLHVRTRRLLFFTVDANRRVLLARHSYPLARHLQPVGGPTRSQFLRFPQHREAEVTASSSNPN